FCFCSIFFFYLCSSYLVLFVLSRVLFFSAFLFLLSSLLCWWLSSGLYISLQSPPALLALCSSLPILGASTVLTVMATGKRIFTRSLTVLSLPGNTTALC